MAVAERYYSSGDVACDGVHRAPLPRISMIRGPLRPQNPVRTTIVDL